MIPACNGVRAAPLCTLRHQHENPQKSRPADQQTSIRYLDSQSADDPRRHFELSLIDRLITCNATFQVYLFRQCDSSITIDSLAISLSSPHYTSFAPSTSLPTALALAEYPARIVSYRLQIANVPTPQPLFTSLESQAGFAVTDHSNHLILWR